jgi:hypothetical protein
MRKSVLIFVLSSSTKKIRNVVGQAKLKLLLIVLTFGFFINVYGQTFPTLEKVLKKELPENSTKDDRWVFYSDKADIEKIDKPLVKAVIPNYDFYEISLTNYLGWHVNEGTCLILFDSSKSKIILVEPLWYGGTSTPLLKLFIGQKFRDKDSLLNFLTQLNELMQVGSGYKFQLTSVTDTSVTYDLGYFKGDTYTTGGNGISSTVRYNDDGVWRKIIIDLRDHRIRRYTEINPKTNDKEIVQ